MEKNKLTDLNDFNREIEYQLLSSCPDKDIKNVIKITNMCIKGDITEEHLLEFINRLEGKLF